MTLSRARSISLLVLVILVAVLLAVALGWWLGTRSTDSAGRSATESAEVIEVVDGDTIVVRLRSGAEETVRLLGIDTPETVHPDRPVECFGPEASAYLTERLLGEDVELEADVERRDHYDRYLAYVYLDGARINDEMIEFGYAEILVIDPNRRYARDLLAAEVDARDAGRGLWGAC